MRTVMRGDDWGKLRRAVLPMTPLLRELCRLFNAQPAAMMQIVHHGQLTIDGYVIRERHLDLWTPAQLQGRYASLWGGVRMAQLYGPAVVRG